MVTPVSSGSNAAIRSTVIRVNTGEPAKQLDSRSKDEAHPASPSEELSVNISSQASLQSQQLDQTQPATDAAGTANVKQEASAAPAASPPPDAGGKVEAKTETISAANSGTNSTVVLDISYAPADADQNGVVSFAEQHAYELKHPEKRVSQNSESPLSRNSSEAVKAYETVSGAGTET